MYFYLEWKDRRPDLINLLNEKPKELNFEETFKIKGKEHTICGWINPSFYTYYPSVKKTHTKSQYLSSHLQKCIRRFDDVKSVKTAKNFIEIDYTSFIRRLPIIMLEDVCLHESFPILIWLMISNTKGFKLKVPIFKWLLGVVYHLSTCKEKTYYSKIIDEINIDNIDDIYINTLRFRKSYGGMKGDMYMIEYYTQNFKNMNVNTDKIFIIKNDIEGLNKNEWLFEANDFHCNKYILNYIKEYFPKYEKEYIKKLIWIFSSSLNYRTTALEYTNKERDVWDNIKKKVKKYQKNCIYY